MTQMSSTEPLQVRIATRKSALALWQANHVAAQLNRQGIATSLVPIVTKGDRILDKPLADIGGKGLFLKEIEDALINHEADIAVHSMKDVPSTMTEALTLAAMLKREDPSDALVGARSIDELRPGAIVGTASLRRHSQIKALRPDIEVKTLRGNVNTRLAKQQAGEYDAIILATVGLVRLQLEQHIGSRFTHTMMLPAVAQGCVGIQCRTSDTRLLHQMAALEDLETKIAITAERHCNMLLGGSCQAPIAIHARWQHNTLQLAGMVGTIEGQICRQSVEATVTNCAEAIHLGAALAEALYAHGAAGLLAH